MAYAHVASAHTCTHACKTQLAVDGESKVQHRSPLGQLAYLAVGSEHENLLLIHIQRKVLAQLIRTGVVFQNLAYAGHHAVCRTLALDALVRPVGSQTTLRDIVHAAGAYLNLHPSVLGSVHRNMQRLVTVALGHAKPVTQTLGVGLVHIGHNAVNLPALRLFLIGRRVQDDADCKEVIYMVQSGVLGLHLVPDAGYGLGATFDGELEPRLLQLGLDRSDERLDVSLTCALGLVELACNVIIDITVLILDHHILHLTLDGVQTQTVGHRDIEQPCLLGNMEPIISLRCA